MKAMIIRESGEPSVFEAADIPVPQIGPGQVLVRVAATSVNPSARASSAISTNSWGSR